MRATEDIAIMMAARETPIHLKFGYAHMIEMRGLEELFAHLPQPDRYFAAVREYERRHAGDPTYRERQEVARARVEKWIVPRADANRRLSSEEVAYLIDRLDGVNDPVGQSILAKLRMLLP